MVKPRHDRPHLWILVTAVNPQTGEVIIVNFTTQRSNSDNSVVIRPGEHPFVDHPTIVFYADARAAELQLLEAAIKQGTISTHAPLCPALLKRVQEGLLLSPYTPGKIKNAFMAAQKQGLA